MAAAAAQQPVSAQVVGNAFVQQYYLIQNQSPALVHRFYQDISKLGHPDGDGAMSTTTTMQAIKEKIHSLKYGEFRAEIKSVDAQESYNGGVHVLVTGYLLGKDNMIQNFTRTFFLAPQEKGYFVLNDIFRYMEVIKHANGNQSSGNDIEAPLTPEQDLSPVVENHVSEQTVVPAEVIAPAPVPRRSPVNSQAQQVNNTQASALVAETPVSGSDATDNGNNQAGEADGYTIYIKGLPMNATDSLLEDEFKKFGTIKAGSVQVRSNKKQGFCFGFVEFEVESAVQKAIEASPVSVGGCQVYVEEKRSTNSRGKLGLLMVKNYAFSTKLLVGLEKDTLPGIAYCMEANVEAIELLVLAGGGMGLVGNNRRRFVNGRGSGFWMEGVRGRGNYGGSGGRGYNRGDFNGRTEFGNNRSSNRGGFSNRGGDGYQRADNHRGSACDMADDSAIVRTDAGLESRELQVYKGDSCQHSSPSTSLEGGGGPNYELYDQLEKTMVEEDKSLREAFEESMRRRDALKDAIDAVRMRERKDFEEALARKAKEVENMSQQVDKITSDLYIALVERLSLQIDIGNSNQMVQESEQNMLSAVEQLEKYKMERDDLQEQASNMIMPLSFPLHEIERATNNFHPSMKIGQGGYGLVYRGFLRHTQVAIKTLISQNMQGRSEFQQEVYILSKLRHPNLVTLIGSCPDACTIIYEYLPNGSLEDRLSCRDNSTPLSWKTRIRIAAELCSVLIFLHSDSIVHGDLKPDNILLDANYVCKLSDFGKCRVVNRNEESSNTTRCYVNVPKGTFGYIDPDFAETGELTQSSDVYSFGVILLRLLTGNKPVVGLPEEMQMALDGGRLKDILDPTVDWPFVQAQRLARLAMRCCRRRNRSRRPDLASKVWRLLEPMRASCDITSFHVSSEESHRTPPYFICPILQDIMLDPQVAADGYTYELEALRGWLDGGHSTSPMTNLQLPHCNVVPNHPLRSAIQEWQQLQRR
ncbi:hypothetical protein RHGRI_036012 [Rhododendron griersonianum]|uniref:RING-type E3 ubiquitin transferase n=1 Tax=Rhododendron griersonianum TaxID=479676 RepID=A0AAV6HQF5_9ERIC|nr:hypothetical protein RHGRI_036012 [Rhododendron griersonianum]